MACVIDPRTPEDIHRITTRNRISVNLGRLQREVDPFAGGTSDAI